MTLKRTRADGGISKEAYYAEAAANGASETAAAMTTTPGAFERAPDGVLATRKIYGPVRATSPSVTAQRHLRALNAALVANLEAQWARNPRGDWSENMREYVAYAREIAAKFAPRAGQVLTCGSGDCGQLGHGVEEDEDMMVPFPRLVALLRPQRVLRVMCGGLHSGVITADGSVYTWGCNDDRALGRDGDENLPARVEGFGAGASAAAMLIVGGDSHTAVVTTAGDVYTWGAYKDKEGKPWCDAPTPSGAFKKMQARPFRVPKLSGVVDVRCGSAFNVVRTGTGEVWSWGLGEMGQLARPVNDQLKDADGNYDVAMVHREHLTPGRVTLGRDALPPAKAIGCGAYHTLVALGAGGDLYASGLNNYGQLGIGSTTNHHELQLVEDLAGRNVVGAEGGTHHSVVLTVDGAVYTFGRADSGQLGTLDQCDTGDFKDRPQKVTFPSAAAVRMIAGGSNHTLALAEDQRLFAWGYGDMLALGTGEDNDENRPRRLDWAKTTFGPADILQIDAGGQHSAILAAAPATDGN